MSKKDLDPRRHSNKVLSRELYYKGDEIIRQGDEAMRAYYLDYGRVEVIVKDEDSDHELKVEELEEGEIFGEMALINNEERSATIRALQTCSVSVISRGDIEDRIDNIADPVVAALIHTLSERLKISTMDNVRKYSEMAALQDRMTGIIESTAFGIDENKRKEFRSEIEPLLDQMQSILDKYQVKSKN